MRMTAKRPIIHTREAVLNKRQLRIKDVDHIGNGTFAIVVSSPTMEEMTLIVEEVEARGLLQFLQASLLTLPSIKSNPIAFPSLTVSDASLVHSAPADVLLLQTNEVGSVALLLDRGIAQKIQLAIKKEGKVFEPSTSTRTSH